MAPTDQEVRRELLALLDRAIAMSDERISRAPSYGALQQVRGQLEEVRADVKRGGQPDADLQQRVMFGRFAVRELEDMDPEYARVLTRAAYLYRERL